MKEDDNECSICFEKINHDENNSISLECNHEFHKACILSWLNEKKECPICRLQVLTDIESAKDEIVQSIETYQSTITTVQMIGPKKFVVLIGKTLSCLYCFLYVFFYARLLEEFIWSVLFVITIDSNTNKIHKWMMRIFGIVLVFDAWYGWYKIFYIDSNMLYYYINITQIILLSINTIILSIL